MAQLGDTTVVGDLSATGKLWGEGNRIYVPDYNTLNPGELNMQVGEIMTVYNDTTDINVSHGPWKSTSAGYIIRNNSATPGTNNSIFTLMIHRSLETADFATRVWKNNKWNNWVIGGTRGSRSTKPSNIHYWDGQSSSTNTDNLYLWRSAIQAAEDYGCSMILEKDPGNSNPKGPIIYYFTKEDLPTSSVTIYSTCYKNTSGNIYTKGNVSNAELYRRSVALTFSNGALSSVGASTNSILTAKSYLTTETLSTTYDGKYFIPSKSYQPVSKGYLETQIITTQKTSKTCELPTDIT